MIYLIEIDPLDEATGQIVTLRYGSESFITEPSDAPGNVTFHQRVADPGNYSRHLFQTGKTRGESDVGGGDIKLVNADRGLDFLLNLAFDGRAVRIFGLEDSYSPWSSRVTLFSGTMEQVTFEQRTVTIRIRDRLAALREPIQTLRFKGTTTSGSSTEAEGNIDLKDVPVPELYGSARLIPPVTVDAFNYIFRVARRVDGVTAVYDAGVALTATQDYATLAALKAASLSAGRYATCNALGLVRTYLRPTSLTVDAFEGATLAQRSAARIVQRMLPSALPLSAASFDALHNANSAECGLWTGTNERTFLSCAMDVLASVGASLNVDRLSIVQVERLELPTGAGTLLDNGVVLDRDEAFERQAPSDEGDGVSAREITLKWGRAYTTYTQQDLANVNATEAFRSFAVQEWRQKVVSSAANAAAHPQGPKLVFETCFCNEADATAEANRLMAIYGARRDIYRLMVSSSYAPTLDLGDVVTLQTDNFGMSAGVPARVLGLTQTYSTNVTEIECWR
ncbi:hypothetical protein [Aureimonas sp. N4]|uniref:hypothetical protein n=1 Tax=Aureimonas sp. N4 TaxID=1638165 RepID=UPI00078615C1|nr:hypothetical protein [Aureimonas sp. N4]